MKPVFEEVDGVAVGMHFAPEVDTDSDGDVKQPTFILPAGIIIDEETGERLGKENPQMGAKTEMSEDLAVEQKQGTRERISTAMRLRETIRDVSDHDITLLTATELVGIVNAAQHTARAYLEVQGIPYTD